MRKRLTAKRFSDDKRESSVSKKADPYLQGAPKRPEYTEDRDHKYEIGDSYDFAEEPDMRTPWQSEKRDPDTNVPLMNKSSKRIMYAKAEIGLKVAELMLPNAPERVVDQQAMDFMDLPISSLKATLRRLSSQTKKAGPEDGMGMAPGDEVPAAPVADDLPADVGGADEGATDGPDMDMSDMEDDEDETLMDPEDKAEEVLEHVQDVLQEVEDVLEEISFDGSDMGGEDVSEDMLVMSSKTAKTQPKVAAKKGIKKLSNVPKAAPTLNESKLLDGLWKSDPDISNLF